MKNYTCVIDTIEGLKLIKRVSKPTARKAFNTGHAIYCVPSKRRPDTERIAPIGWSCDDLPWLFDEHIEFFANKHCNHESGLSIHYYIEYW